VLEHIRVPFTGTAAGTADLSWGQAEIWRAMRRQRSWLPLVTVTPLAPGMTENDAAAELRLMMSRYPSMRTRLLPRGAAGPRGERGQIHSPWQEDGPWQDGDPCQALADSGVATLDVVHTGGDPAATAAGVKERYLRSEWDLIGDWPLRMTVIRHRGALTHMVTAISHLAIDGFGTVAMRSDLASVARSSGVVAPSPMSPLEQARWQQSPAGLRVSAAAMRHWEKHLAAVPLRRFPGTAGCGQGGYAEARFASPALYQATRVVATHTGLGTSPVLLAAFALALGQLTGSNPVLVQVVVSNRFRPGLAETVSQVAQTGLCVIDVAGASFAETVTRAWRGSMAAHRHAYYSPADLDQLLSRLSEERGGRLDIDCFYNDRRMGGRTDPGGPLPTRQEIQGALTRSTLRWDRRPAQPSEKFFLHIDDAAGSVDMLLSADTSHVSTSDMETCLRAMEEITVRAALGLLGHTNTDLAPVCK
jgi:Condensation domain